MSPKLVFKLAVLVHSFLTATTPAQWIEVNDPQLPDDDQWMACGYYNGTIFLLGGFAYKRTIKEYDIAHNTLTYAGDVLSRDTGGRSYYTQINNTMYMIDTATGQYINTFDLETKEFTSESPSQHMQTAVTDSACLTSTNDHLYVIGGDDSNGIKTVQIYSFPSNTWNYAPDMLEARSKCTCTTTSNGKLYAIGGRNAGIEALDIVEFIHIANIHSNVWQQTSDKLTGPVRSVSSVFLDPFIYVIGGWYPLSSNSNSEPPYFHIIDTNTDDIYLSDDQLMYGGPNFASIIFDYRIYVFGRRQTWQHYDLPSPDPTTDAPTTNRPTTQYIPSSINTMEYGASTDDSSIPMQTITALRTSLTNSNEEILNDVDSDNDSKLRMGDRVLIAILSVIAFIAVVCCVILVLFIVLVKHIFTEKQKKPQNDNVNKAHLDRIISQSTAQIQNIGNVQFDKYYADPNIDDEDALQYALNDSNIISHLRNVKGNDNMLRKSASKSRFEQGTTGFCDAYMDQNNIADDEFVVEDDMEGTDIGVKANSCCEGRDAVANLYTVEGPFTKS